jgi:hypothetical protein
MEADRNERVITYEAGSAAALVGRLLVERTLVVALPEDPPERRAARAALMKAGWHRGIAVRWTARGDLLMMGRGRFSYRLGSADTYQADDLETILSIARRGVAVRLILHRLDPAAQIVIDALRHATGSDWSSYSVTARSPSIVELVGVKALNRSALLRGDDTSDQRPPRNAWDQQNGPPNI